MLRYVCTLQISVTLRPPIAGIGSPLAYYSLEGRVLVEFDPVQFTVEVDPAHFDTA